MVRQTSLAIALLSGLSGYLLAGEVADLAREAEAKAGAGQHVEAYETLRRAMYALTANGPLTLRRVQFIAEPPKGFGIFEPRPNNVFKPGEPLIIYAEPVGMGWKPDGEFHRAEVLTDFEIRSPEGKILAGQKDFGRFAFTSYDRNQEIMTHLIIKLSGAPNGKYVFGATYRDQVNGKSSTLELPFEIR